MMALVSLLLFSGCTRWLMVVLRQPIPTINLSSYSKQALKVKKAYSVMALGLMTLVFLGLLTLSWVELFNL